MPYLVEATSEYGEGYTQTLGTYDNVEDIKINVTVLAPHVQITIEEIPEIKENL